ncbi:MAG: ATP-binding protein [Melioribacteraceae bacterium]|nr:ATP-binding protein [Melioribacteraceae bacterium]
MSELHLGTYELSLNEIDLVDMLQRLATEYEVTARSKGVKLLVESEIETAKILCDDYALNQIIANLLDNAVKYTKEGFVRLKLLSKENENYVIEIADTGIGISEEYLPEIFEAFSQEEQGYSRQYDGTGLGLSLVKKYCDIIGGELSIESKKNVGTKVRIELKIDAVDRSSP